MNSFLVFLHGSLSRVYHSNGSASWTYFPRKKNSFSPVDFEDTANPWTFQRIVEFVAIPRISMENISAWSYLFPSWMPLPLRKKKRKRKRRRRKTKLSASSFTWTKGCILYTLTNAILDSTGEPLDTFLVTLREGCDTSPCRSLSRAWICFWSNGVPTWPSPWQRRVRIESGATGPLTGILPATGKKLTHC